MLDVFEVGEIGPLMEPLAPGRQGLEERKGTANHSPGVFDVSSYVVDELGRLDGPRPITNAKKGAAQRLGIVVADLAVKKKASIETG